MSFSEEKRKKLIVPAVALMMCAVAMIGIGYAQIQSSVTNNNNEIGVISLSADLYDGSSKATSTLFDIGNIKYATTKNSQDVDYTFTVDTDPITISKDTAKINCISTNTKTTPIVSSVGVVCSYTASGGNLTVQSMKVTIGNDEKNVTTTGSDTWTLNTNIAYGITIKVSFESTTTNGLEPESPKFSFTFTATEQP